jgi:hypothetical protein
MTGDHHGREAERATLLVRAMEEILGTHSFDLALEHGDLVPQDENLGVLGLAGPGDQGEPAEHAQYSLVGES